MTILPILLYPDARLRRVAEPVSDYGPVFQQLVDDMFETLYASKNCAALALTQLDTPYALHVTVIDFSPKKDQPLCLVNAKIVGREGETCTKEGCMSVIGGIYQRVTRAKKIQLKAQDRYGKPLNFDADGFMAKCIQHELDHLDARLFIDYLSSLKLRLIEKKIYKAVRKQQKKEK